MTDISPYVLLGVGRGASKDEIHDAYRTLAKRYHPDLNPGDATAERSFKEIAAAYQLLSDPLERARFDRESADSPGDGAQDNATAGYHFDDPRPAPRRHYAEEPSGFRRAPTIDDTGFDPDKGYQTTEPDQLRRFMGGILILAVLISLVVESLDLGSGWRPGEPRLIPFRLSPTSILFGIVAFVASCGAVMAWIMNGVERRARDHGGKR